jgi:hypothetical protein
VAITLGKDCTLTIGINAVVGVRSVTAEESVTEQEFVPFGSRKSHVYPTAYGITVQIETIDDSYDFVTALEDGTELNVVGTGFSFVGVVTSVSDSQPLDGPRTFNVTMRRTYAGLR